jgi:hypothetical protein
MLETSAVMTYDITIMLHIQCNMRYRRMIRACSYWTSIACRQYLWMILEAAEHAHPLHWQSLTRCRAVIPIVLKYIAAQVNDATAEWYDPAAHKALYYDVIDPNIAQQADTVQLMVSTTECRVGTLVSSCLPSWREPGALAQWCTLRANAPPRDWSYGAYESLQALCYLLYLWGLSLTTSAVVT